MKTDRNPAIEDAERGPISEDWIVEEVPSAGPRGRSEGRIEGLCSNCIHKDSCMYLKTSNGPILHCELFDAREKAAPPLQVPSHEAVVVVMKKETKVHKGLCATCKHRDNCSLCADKEGVWHCEEYE